MPRVQPVNVIHGYIEHRYLWEHKAWFKPYAAGFYAFWYGEAKDIERAAVEHDLDRWLALGQPWLYWSHDREE
jgi:hypothetical protein